MSVMEEFLYTREICIKEYLPLLPQNVSRRKNVDQEIFNKFSHLSSEADRKIIADTQLTSSGIEGMNVNKKCRVLEQAKKFVVKSQDELDLLEIDPEKENFQSKYRKNIINFALCGRRKAMQCLQSLLPEPSLLEGMGEELL